MKLKKCMNIYYLLRTTGLKSMQNALLFKNPIQNTGF